jgi:hypothetical protein
LFLNGEFAQIELQRENWDTSCHESDEHCTLCMVPTVQVTKKARKWSGRGAVILRMEAKIALLFELVGDKSLTPEQAKAKASELLKESKEEPKQAAKRKPDSGSLLRVPATNANVDV